MKIKKANQQQEPSSVVSKLLKLKSIFLIFILFITIDIYSQSAVSGTTTPHPYEAAYIASQMNNPTDPYEIVKERAEAFFDGLPEGSKTEEIERLDEYFERWVEYWDSHVAYFGSPAGGDVNGAKALLAAAAQDIPYCATSVAGAQPWSPEGPMSSPLCNLGIITALSYDPNNANTIYAGSNTGGLFKTTDHGGTWVNITNNNIAGIGILPSMGIGSIAVDPNNSNNILVGTTTPAFGNGFGMGILISNNGGASWSLSNIVGSPAGGRGVGKIIISNSGAFILAAIGTDIFKSTDGGATFNLTTMIPNLNGNYTYPICSNVNNYQEQVANNIIDIEQSLSNPAIFYASTNTYGPWSGSNGPSKLLISTDNAQTWNLLNLPTANAFDALSVDVTPAEPGAVFIYYNNDICANNQGTAIFAKSTDNGATWTILNQEPNSGYGFFSPIFEVSNTNNTDYFIAGLTTFKFTYSNISNSYSNASVTAYWPTLGVDNQHGDIRAIALRTNGANTEVIVGCDGGVIESLTGGDYGTWTCINGTGLNISQFYSISTFNKSSNIIASPQDNWVKLKSASGWNVANSGSESCWSEVDYTNDDIVYYSEYSYINKSIDGGLTRTPIGSPGGYGSLGRRFYLDPTNHNYLWTGSPADHKLYRYDNSSNTWSMMHNPVSSVIDPGTGSPRAISHVSAIAVSPSNKNVIYEAHDGGASYTAEKFYRTTDGGTTWVDITTNLGNVCTWAYISHIEFDPFNENRVFVSVGAFWPSSNPTQGVQRVMYSNDGGTTWSDMSNGLTPFPVSYLDYQNGSDDVIYAATDAGVYRWNKASSTWECFNLGLPNTGVRKVEINYCQNKLYAAVYGRGAYSVPLPAIPDFHISSLISPGNVFNVSQDFNQAFNNNIIADAGITVNIKGTMNFGPNGSYLVGKKNHTVITGTMSTNCANFWNGIKVGGDISHNQNFTTGGFALYQGFLEVNNGGTIKNAQNGIVVAVYDDQGNLDWSSMGGIVYGNSGNFINNSRDVAFLAYPFQNRSRFNKCVFEVNSTLLGNYTPEGRISLWEVQGVAFNGSDFRYTAGSAYPQGFHGYGIYSNDAKYSVNAFCLNLLCTSKKRGTFSNFDVGVYAANSNPLRTVNVRDNDFTGQFTDAARFAGVNYVTFVGNNVNVGAPGSPGLASAVYMDNSKFYSIENNNLTTSFVGSNVGVYTLASGAGAHLVNRNNINNLLIGVAPMDDNSGDNNFTDGLKIKCNNFTANTPNTYDIALLSDGNNLSNPSVAFVQGLNSVGTPSLLVGNQYKAICGNESKWWVSPNTVKSSLHANHTDLNSRITPQPSCSNALMVPNNTSISYLPAHCPDNYGNKKILVDINSNLVAAKAAAISSNSLYNSTIDGGNTQVLLSAINSGMSSGNLKNLMEQKSPYLSDAVLIAYFSKLSTPPGHIKDIHDKNKPVSSSVWQVITSLNLPNGIMKGLNEQQATTVLSPRTVLQAKLSNAIFDKELAYTDKIRYYLNDTIESSQDSAIQIIKNSGFQDADCQYIAGEAGKANTTLTASQIDAMHGGANNVDDFCSFQKLVLELNGTLKKIYTLKEDPNIKGQMILVANGNKEGYRQAQSLLQKVFNTSFPILRLQPTTNSNRLMQSNDEELTSIELLDGSLTMYPNPTSNQVNVIFKSENIDGAKYQLEIRNLLGQTIINKEIENNKVTDINTANLTSALYTVSILQDGKVIKETKLVIVK